MTCRSSATDDPVTMKFRPLIKFTKRETCTYQLILKDNTNDFLQKISSIKFHEKKMNQIFLNTDSASLPIKFLHPKRRLK